MSAAGYKVSANYIEALVLSRPHTNAPPHCSQEPRYLVTALELDQIKNDCAYPERESCDGCPLADGEDETRASGFGCNFKGANVLMDEILAHSHPSPQQPPVSPASATVPEEQLREAYQNGFIDGQAKAAIENERINAQVAKAELERVLDDLVYWMYDCPFGGREGSDRCHTILAHKIESLRAQQEPQQEGRL
jgi:hypothetical protein